MQTNATLMSTFYIYPLNFGVHTNFSRQNYKMWLTPTSYCLSKLSSSGSSCIGAFADESPVHIKETANRKKVKLED